MLGKIALLLFFSLGLFYETSMASEICPPPWQCRRNQIEVLSWGVVFERVFTLTPTIRSGYITENPEVPFRGNVIYYQGLGDSMLNHLPLFQLLASAGFRVIAFDYMGQGGSSGSMDDTRIIEITELGDKVWKMHARDLAAFPKKTIIGWSTGGLAAYAEAALLPGTVANVVLIAPGLVPNKIVGEQDWLQGKINRITLPTLTTARYEGGVPNPHVDPIRPDSPVKVMSFALDLLVQAHEMRQNPVLPSTKGLVLLSGSNDTYVNAGKTRLVIARRAPHFKIVEYPHTLHEIDNEAAPQGDTAKNDILDFLFVN